MRKINASVTSLSINGPTVTYNKHDGTVNTEIINLDSIYAKRTGTLADEPITRTSPSGRTVSFMQSGYATDENEICDIGWDYDNEDGALLGLSSASRLVNAGQFSLLARDTVNESNLIGLPDGTLKWNNKSLINNGEFNKIFFSQTSGNYTAPYTGVYRITLKGGGGGGGGAQTTTGRSGGGGGEGATRTIYFTLTKDTQYEYVIGAGGTAGVSSATLSDVTSGGSGGTSYFRYNGSNYTSAGGSGGNHSQTTARGGAGGNVNSGIGFSLPGANGCSGVWEASGFSRPAGGGCRGAIGDQPALTGGGGQGANSSNAATAGADGYILIEYAS